MVTGIVGFYFRTTVEGSSSNGYRTRLNDAIRDYRKNPDDLSYNDNINSAVDYLQNIVSVYMSPHSTPIPSSPFFYSLIVVVQTNQVTGVNSMVTTSLKTLTTALASYHRPVIVY